MHLEFEPAEVTQVDFGTGLRLVDSRVGEELKT